MCSTTVKTFSREGPAVQMAYIIHIRYQFQLPNIHASVKHIYQRVALLIIHHKVCAEKETNRMLN